MAAILWAGPESFVWAGRSLAQVGGALAVAAALWLLPGLAVLRWLWPGRQDGLTRLTLALGVGVALPPLGLLLFDVVGLPWGRWTTVAYVGAAVVGLAAPRGRIAVRPSIAAAAKHILRRGGALATSWPGGLLAGLTLLAVVGRLYLVRDLPAGLWGDSYHHTMITQLLVDNAGLFTSWLPYAPLTTFTYHFGFHANAALWHWLSGLPVTQSVLVAGQMLSAATLPAAYLLAARLTGSKAAGVWAALLTGFINVQPAYYFNWGRYTQLTGQVMLAAMLLAWVRALERPRFEWRAASLAALLTAGLFLTHYVVAVFAALFLAAYAVARVVVRPRWRTAAQMAGRGLAVGLGAMLLAVPWLANTLGGYLVRNTAGFVNGGVEAARIAGYASLPPVPPLMLKSYILALAAAGLVAALARRRWRAAVLAAWAGLMVFAVVPHLAGLPGSGIIDHFAVYITLYLPLAPLAGYALVVGQHWAQRWAPRLAAAGAGAVVIAGSVWGYGWQLDNLYAAQHQLFTPADAQAVAWITASTEPEARFFVNAFPAFGGTLVAGSDGGWWLPLLAGRETNLPPITYGSERGPADDYYAQVNGLAVAMRGQPLSNESAITIDLTQPENHARLIAAGYDYVYSGAHAQPGPGAGDHIDANLLRARPDLFALVYDQGGVQIFAVRPASP